MPSLEKDDDAVTNGSHSHADSSEGVKLGIDQLERQQRDLEAKRRQQATTITSTRRRTGTSSSSLTIPATGAVRRANPFEMMTPRSAPETAAGDVPSTVHLNEIGRRELDDETLGQGSLEDNGKKRLKRATSFGKMLKTPLVGHDSVSCIVLISTCRDSPTLPISLFGRCTFSQKQTQKLTRKVTDRFSADPSQMESSLPTIGSEPLIQGYLHKFGRHGQWQKRWFQTDGVNLYYYKSEKLNKLLATLDLKKVGAIEMDPSDPAGCTFYIDVSGRKYHLCAEAMDWAKEWVIQLNVVRDARMNHGGLKLVDPTLEEEANGVGENTAKRPRSYSEDYTARVVIEAQRPRTKGLGKDDFSDLEQSLEENHELPGSGMHLTSVMSPTGSMESSNMSHLDKPIAERWRKRRSPFQNLARRLSRWARRMRMLRCVIKDDVIHLHSENHSEEQVGRYQTQGKDRNYPKIKKLSNAFIQNASTLTGNYAITQKEEKKNDAPFIDLDLDPTLAQLSQFPIVENKVRQ